MSLPRTVSVHESYPVGAIRISPALQDYEHFTAAFEAAYGSVHGDRYQDIPGPDKRDFESSRQSGATEFRVSHRLQDRLATAREQVISVLRDNHGLPIAETG